MSRVLTSSETSPPDLPVGDETAQRLAAIVESSDDAILAKDLNSTIVSWNSGAERLFGYTAAEAIGQSVTMLIPEDRVDEEPNILARIRAGERIDHYETIRRRKDGGLIHISLSVSPIRGANGEIIGAAKIARDITERRRAEEQQFLLIKEMDHRVKNLFTLASGVVTLSARSSATVPDLVSAVTSRLQALAQAHALTIPKTPETTGKSRKTVMLHALIRTMLAPYEESGGAGSRAAVTGPDIAIGGNALTSVALLLHEFTTNAAKYGALSTPGGRIDIACAQTEDRFVLTWTESGGPAIARQPGGEGFGTLLATGAVEGQLGGEIVRHWKPEGLSIRLTVDAKRLGA
jgi:PAS domain S-box-containing protein